MEKHIYCKCLVNRDTGFERFSFCSNESFKDDLTKLCEHCPTKDKIKHGIVRQIELLANENKELRTKESFKDYIANEVKSGSKTIERIRLKILQEDEKNILYEVMQSRVETYIWNKERLKALKKYTEITSPMKPRIQATIENLNKYNLSKYLYQKNIEPNKFNDLFSKYSGKSFFPFVIALLYESQYLNYFFNEFTKTKKEGHKKLGEIFDTTDRRVRGNVNVMNPESKEDPLQYTSHKYIEEAQKELKKIERGYTP